MLIRDSKKAAEKRLFYGLKKYRVLAFILACVECAALPRALLKRSPTDQQNDYSSQAGKNDLKMIVWIERKTIG